MCKPVATRLPTGEASALWQQWLQKRWNILPPRINQSATLETNHFHLKMYFYYWFVWSLTCVVCVWCTFICASYLFEQFIWRCLTQSLTPLTLLTVCDGRWQTDSIHTNPDTCTNSSVILPLQLSQQAGHPLLCPDNVKKKAMTGEHDRKLQHEARPERGTQKPLDNLCDIRPNTGSGSLKGSG